MKIEYFANIDLNHFLICYSLIYKTILFEVWISYMGRVKIIVQLKYQNKREQNNKKNSFNESKCQLVACNIVLLCFLFM